MIQPGGKHLAEKSDDMRFVQPQQSSNTYALG